MIHRACLGPRFRNTKIQALSSREAPNSKPQRGDNGRVTRWTDSPDSVPALWFQSSPFRDLEIGASLEFGAWDLDLAARGRHWREQRMLIARESPDAIYLDAGQE